MDWMRYWVYLFIHSLLTTLDPPDLDLGKPPSSEHFPLLAVPQVNHRTLQISEAEDRCRLYYYYFLIESPTTTVTAQYALSTVAFEFPTVNPSREMSYARYVYGCSTSAASFGTALVRAVKVDVLVKMNVHKLTQRGQDNPPWSITGCVDQCSVDEIMMSSDPDDRIKCFKCQRDGMRRRRDLCSGTTQRIPVPLILPLATVRMTDFFSSTLLMSRSLTKRTTVLKQLLQNSGFWMRGTLQICWQECNCHKGCCTAYTETGFRRI